jgi:DNA-3-methyladenine glycosylase
MSSKGGRILKAKFLINYMGPGLRLTKDFYLRDVLDVAPGILGKQLVLKNSDKTLKRFLITEVEAYRGPEDLACHASKGRTPRTEIMFHPGGNLYVYFVYGMYWMLNVVTGKIDEPQAVLIRGIEGYNGPGKLTKMLGIDRSYYGEDLTESDRIWIEDAGLKPEYKTSPRIGINYAGDYWKEVPWRYIIKSPLPLFTSFNKKRGERN